MYQVREEVMSHDRIKATQQGIPREGDTEKQGQ
jgi:hypothetical protein